MKFQLTLLALAASTAQVMAVPVEEAQDIQGTYPLHLSQAFDSKPADKKFEAASTADEDSVISAACHWCPSPCGNSYCCDGAVPYCGYLTNPFECICWGPV